MEKFAMAVNTKVAGKYSLVGFVNVYYPLLSELGFDVEPKEAAVAPTFDADGSPVLGLLDKDGKPTTEVNQKLPVYSNEAHDWAFKAIFASVKADARNKLEGGTVKLKNESSPIAETLEELLAETERSGEALKLRQAMLAAFKEYLKGSGKKEKTQEAILGFASNAKVLKLQTSDTKAKFLAHWQGFQASISDALYLVWQKPYEVVETAASSDDCLEDM